MATTGRPPQMAEPWVVAGETSLPKNGNGCGEENVNHSIVPPRQAPLGPLSNPQGGSQEELPLPPATTWSAGGGRGLGETCALWLLAARNVLGKGVSHTQVSAQERDRSAP